MVIGRFAEYHSRRGTRVVEPVEYGGIDGLEEVGEIRDIGCGNDETQRIEKDEEERRGAVKPTGGVAEPSGYPEYRQRQQQDVTGDDVVEPEAAQERHALQGIVFRYLFREIIVCGDKKRDTESEEEQQCYEMYT